MRERYEAIRLDLRARQQQERQLLKDKQSRLYVRIIALLDITGRTRRRQEAARKALAKDHTTARKELSERYHKARLDADRAVKDRYAKQVTDERGKRLAHLAQLGERHRQADDFADIERQQREIEREHMRKITDKKLEAHQREQGDQKSGKTSGDDFARALKKAAKQEKERDDKNKGPDRGYER